MGKDMRAKLRPAKDKEAEKEKEKRKKAKLLKRVKKDVFIPSTVSVGQLARLLNVRMGEHYIMGFCFRINNFGCPCRVVTAEDGRGWNGRRVCI
jgi:hypothetical protein